MKKTIVITVLIATSLCNTARVNADASIQENIGFVSGAITGAAVAGPIGFIVGAAVGALIGDEVEKGAQLEQVKFELTASNQQAQQLKQEVAMLQQKMQFDTLNYKRLAPSDTQWMTEGLTLNLMFTTGSSSLSDNDHNNIKQISSLLKRHPQLDLKLDGYTDPRGSQAFNLALSQDRVDTVKAALEVFGVAPARIISQAHGETTGVTLEGNNDSYALVRKVSLNFVEQSVGQVAQN